MPDAAAILRLLSQDLPLIVATDTVVGLCALPDNAAALQNIYRLKNRDAGKPLALLARSPDCVRDFAEFTPAAAALFTLSPPGSVTFILPRKAGSVSLAPALNPGLGTIGVRFPAPSPVRDLLTAIGRPLAATSANASGEPPALTLAEAQAYFPGLPCLYGDCAGAANAPSSVIDFTQKSSRRLR